MNKYAYLPFFTFFASITLVAQSPYLFLGSFNRDKSKESMYVYQLNTSNGRLKKITSVKGILNPSYLELSPDGRFVYACTESKTPGAGSVSSFEFNPEKKTLRFLNSQPSGGENPVYVTVHRNGKWLVNGNYTEGSVSVYPLAENGTIGKVAQNIQFAEGSVNAWRQERAHIHAAVFSPDYEYIFFTDLGADKIRCYRFDTALAEPLIPLKDHDVNTNPGSGPRHFTFHPNGKFAYCIEELSGAVSAYAYENGRLQPVQWVYAHPEKIIGEFESSDIHVSPDGRFLYASNRGAENDIAVFSIENEASLKLCGTYSCGGVHPRTFAIDPTGNFLIVTNVVTGNVIVFRINRKTGALKTLRGELKIDNVSCITLRAYRDNP